MDKKRNLISKIETVVGNSILKIGLVAKSLISHVSKMMESFGIMINVKRKFEKVKQNKSQKKETKKSKNLIMIQL